MKTTKATKAKIKDESPPRARLGRPPGRSPSRRQKSPGAKPKSPSRKSPARKSPSRKSPARKTPLNKSPSRKSPSRTAKELKAANNIRDMPYVVLPRSDIIKNDIFPYEDTQKLFDIKNGIDTNNIRTGLRERKPRGFTESYTMSRRTTKIKENDNLEYIAQNTELPKHDFSNDDVRNDPFSDDDMPRRLITPIREVRKPYFEFGGPIGTTLIMISSIVFIIVNISCSKQSCSFTKLPDLSQYAKLESWFTLRSFVAITCYHLLLIALTLVPYFGKKTTVADGKNKFVANSVFSMFVVIGAIVAIEKFYTSISQIIYEDYIQLLIVSYVYGHILTAALYIKSKNIPIEERNPYGNSGIAAYDIYMGREIYPIFFRTFHVKIILFRIALIGVILINLAWMYCGAAVNKFPSLNNQTIWEFETYSKIATSVSINPTLLLFGAMQIIYLLDSLVLESHQVSTFEFAYEGVGYLTSVGYLSYPFIITILTKRILDQNIQLPNYVLIGTLILFLAGYYIYRASNLQKSIFRANPLDSRIAHLETIPTMHGKRLLISGWWGFLRHPNYLGDIMMHLAWAIGTYNALPIYLFVFTLWMLVNRIKRDNSRCDERYGVAWTRYCKRVPYCLIPKVY